MEVYSINTYCHKWNQGSIVGNNSKCVFGTLNLHCSKEMSADNPDACLWHNFFYGEQAKRLVQCFLPNKPLTEEADRITRDHIDTYGSHNPLCKIDSERCSKWVADDVDDLCLFHRYRMARVYCSVCHCGQLYLYYYGDYFGEYVFRKYHGIEEENDEIVSMYMFCNDSGSAEDDVIFFKHNNIPIPYFRWLYCEYRCLKPRIHSAKIIQRAWRRYYYSCNSVISRLETHFNSLAATRCRTDNMTIQEAEQLEKG